MTTLWLCLLYLAAIGASAVALMLRDSPSQAR